MLVITRELSTRLAGGNLGDYRVGKRNKSELLTFEFCDQWKSCVQIVFLMKLIVPNVQRLEASAAC